MPFGFNQNKISMVLSVIVPVYNAAKWVEACVASIAGQDGFETLCEVLLVDDGSKDGSGSICKRLAAEHSNVRCLSEPNSGPATARNLGMSHARGEYVWFVDADDQIAPGALRLLADCIERNSHPDAVCFNYRYVYESSYHDAVDFERETVIEPAIDILEMRAKLYAVNRIYRREAVQGVRWPDGLINTEDFYFTVMALAGAQRLVTLPQVLYYYNCANPASTLRDRSRRKLVRNRNHTLAVHQMLAGEIARCSDEHTRRLMQNALNVSIGGQLYCALLDHTPHFVRRTIARYRQMGLYPVGMTHNRKANRFLRLANHEWLLLTALRLLRLQRKRPT